jgi:hypothetical protein
MMRGLTKQEQRPPDVADIIVTIMILETPEWRVLNMVPAEPPLKNSQLQRSITVPKTQKGTEFCSKVVSDCKSLIHSTRSGERPKRSSFLYERSYLTSRLVFGSFSFPWRGPIM